MRATPHFLQRAVSGFSTQRKAALSASSPVKPEIPADNVTSGLAPAILNIHHDAHGTIELHTGTVMSSLSINEQEQLAQVLQHSAHFQLSGAVHQDSIKGHSIFTLSMPRSAEQTTDIPLEIIAQKDRTSDHRYHLLELVISQQVNEENRATQNHLRVKFDPHHVAQKPPSVMASKAEAEVSLESLPQEILEEIVDNCPVKPEENYHGHGINFVSKRILSKTVDQTRKLVQPVLQKKVRELLDGSTGSPGQIAAFLNRSQHFLDNGPEIAQLIEASRDRIANFLTERPNRNYRKITEFIRENRDALVDTRLVSEGDIASIMEQLKRAITGNSSFSVYGVSSDEYLAICDLTETAKSPEEKRNFMNVLVDGLAGKVNDKHAQKCLLRTLELSGSQQELLDTEQLQKLFLWHQFIQPQRGTRTDLLEKMTGIFEQHYDRFTDAEKAKGSIALIKSLQVGNRKISASLVTRLLRLAEDNLSRNNPSDNFDMILRFNGSGIYASLPDNKSRHEHYKKLKSMIEQNLTGSDRKHGLALLKTNRLPYVDLAGLAISRLFSRLQTR